MSHVSQAQQAGQPARKLGRKRYEKDLALVRESATRETEAEGEST